MADGYISGGGGSSKIINGIIDEYLAETETINSNTFVEFVNGNTTYGTNDVKLSPNNYKGLYRFSLALSDTKILILYNSDNVDRRLYGVIVTVENSTISTGTETLISSVRDSAYYGIAGCLMSENKVFVSYSGTNKYLTGVVITIQDSTITIGTPIVLYNTEAIYNGSDNQLSQPCYAFQLTSSKLVLFFGTSQAMYIFIISIVGNNISVSKVDKNTNYSISKCCVSRLSEYKYIFTWQYSIPYMTAIVVIENDTITYGGSVTLNPNSGTNQAVVNYVQSLTEDKAIIVYTRYQNASGASTSNSYFVIRIASIKDKSITLSNEIGTNYSSTSTVSIMRLTHSVALINFNNVMTIFSCVGISGTITQLNNIVFPVNGSSYLTNILSIKLPNDKLFFSANVTDSYTLGFNTGNYSGTSIKKAISSICGITKSKCTTTTKGKVWVLNE